MLQAEHISSEIKISSDIKLVFYSSALKLVTANSSGFTVFVM